MRHKLKFLLTTFLLVNFFVYSQTFVRNYSGETTEHQLKMDFSPQSWGDVYLVIEVKNTGQNDISVKNSKVQFLSDAIPGLVNFVPNGGMSYPKTVSMKSSPNGDRYRNTIDIELSDESWVDYKLSSNESFKAKINLKTVTSSYESLADAVRFYPENGDPSLFVNVITTVTGNDSNTVEVTYKNNDFDTQVTKTITTTNTGLLRINKQYQIWANDFISGSTVYKSKYSKTSPLSFLPSDTNKTISVPYTKSTIKTENLIVNVNGLPNGVSTTIDLKNKDINNVTKNEKIVEGSNTITKVMEGSYSVTISSYTDTDKDIIYMPRYDDNLTISVGKPNQLDVSFVSYPIKEFTVKGFPKYLSHGTITSAASAIDEGLKKAPLSVLFKYSGIDGAGDRGKIPDMTATINTIKQARRLETNQEGKNILPVMVHYTANASGGGSGEAIKDMTEHQNLYFHYRNLIQEIKVMLSYEDADHPNPGAFVISPDLIGAIQQDVVFGNDHNIRTIKVDVNQDIKKAFKDENLSIDNIPSFSDNLKGYFQSINFLIHHVGECKIPFGYQQNVWSAGSARWVYKNANEYNDPVSEATEIADFMNDLELYTGDWKPDFIAFDRYERDCFGPVSIDSYAWTAKHWDKYLIFCKEIAERIGNAPIMLWQIPGGHMPTADENIINFDIANHSSASAPFFLGDKRIGTDLNKIHPDLKKVVLTQPHYAAKNIGEHLGNDNGYDWSTSNMQKLADMNVFTILWGGGSTTGIAPIGTNGDDDQWLAAKITDYYKKPVYKTISIVPYQDAAYCQNTTVSSSTQNDMKKTLDVKIFPNPAKDQLQIENYVLDKDFVITIYNIYGEKIVDYKNQKLLDVSNLSKGAYIIKLQYIDSLESNISKIFYKR
ncbi:T9SS type A sorting domain-containing protein [Aquimarina megaterium]|uniref:T9SS type A sorting domain-containing protein n=1 Tax=Aquimarina megaterium TaxID=1443666 RepID=UPI0015868A1D|nr:T9SS type A sorting domain-containing protein [Aquimarina megaterium]